MTHSWPTRFFVFLILFAFSATPAGASQVSRADLMALAHQFVDKVGQKLSSDPGDVPSDHRSGSVQGDNVVQIPENELLLLTPRLSNNVVVDATVGAYRRHGLLYLSFYEFCTGMQFPIIFSRDRRSAEGWYLREKYAFHMDLNKGYVQSRTDQFTVSNSEWFVEEGVVYISAESIRKWMHVDYDVRWDAQLVDFAADVPFPLEDRIARRKRKLEKDDHTDIPQLPRVDNPPRLISVPSTQVSLTSSYNKPQGATQATRTHSASITTSGDVLGHTTRTLVGMNNADGLSLVRVKAEKRSEQGDLLGPLQAKQYEFGDVDPISQPLMGAASEQVGARVTNAGDNERVGSTRRTFEGDLPPGWDVELYNENQLIAFQTVDDTGRYRFADVDLYAGDNNFRLVFYGPQGEVREEEVKVPIDLETVGADRGLYDISATLNDVHTYDKEPSATEDRGTPDLSMTYEQGITKGLTLGTGFRRYQANGMQKTLVSGDAVTRLGQTLVNTTVVADESSEGAAQAVLRRSIGAHNIRSSTMFATQAFDPGNSGSSPKTFLSSSEIRGPLVDFFGEKVTYALNTNISQTADNTKSRDVQFYQNTRIGSYVVGHALKWASSDSAQGPKTTTTASEFNVRRNIGTVRVRAGARYVYAPQSELESLSLNLAENFNEDLQGQLEITHDVGSSVTKSTARLNWVHPNFVLSPSLTVGTNNEMRAAVNMRFGVVHDDDTGKTKITHDLVNNQGAVVAHVFLDKDGNNKFDGDDTPIEGAVIKSLQSVKFAKTESDGAAFMSNLPEYIATDIVLEGSTLGDPFYVSTFKGMSVYPRPGAPAHIDFPVHMAGELDGRVMRPQPNGMQPVGGVHVELIDLLGHPVSSSLTAYDGYYVLSLIPPGSYLLRLNPDDLKDTGLRQSLPRVVTFGYDGAVVAGQDIALSPGTEVPIHVIPVSDKPVVTSLTGPADALSPPVSLVPKITMVFGAYRSYLLATLLKYRIYMVLNVEKMRVPNIYDRPKEGSPTGESLLVADLSGNDFDQAYQICATLTAKHMRCSLGMTPDILFRNAAGTAQQARARGPEPVLAARETIKVESGSE